MLTQWQKKLHQTRVGLTNAAKLMLGARFTPPYEAPYTQALQEGILKLRHYTPHSEHPQDRTLAPLLLIPPLMVTAQVYDISPSLSAIASLLRAGCDVWLADFGIPEHEPGGMQRTLDDHLVAIDRAVDHIRDTTGRKVHLLGYSQGGMFAYQAAAYRHSADIASVITFGSPVDLRRNAPGKVHADLVQRTFSAIRSALGWTLNDLKGIPGHFSSLGFKLVSPRQEIRYLRMMLGMLDDKEALSRLEPTRRFLGGEGFISWPGPALRSFIEEIVVQNRMMSGGLVVAGKTVSLADITCPILYFLGYHDDFARPPSVRGISKVAIDSEIYEVGISAGHFGLVVGSRAQTQVWPVVLDWCRWQAGQAELPDVVQHVHHTSRSRMAETSPDVFHDPSWRERTADLMQDAWERMGEAALDTTAAIGWMRWQTPRLLRLLRVTAGLRVSMSRILAHQARRIPDRTFFLWQGRAFTYQQANIRVNQVLWALIRVGVRPGQNVGVLMDNHPDYLTVLAALSRMGSVAVLLNPSTRGDVLRHAIRTSDVDTIVVNPTHALEVRDDLPHTSVLVLGPISQLPPDTISLDQHIRATDTEPPNGIIPDPGKPDDVALYIFTSGTTGLPKAAKITNRRWMLGATLSAVSGSLTPNDTVYCCLPLYHGSGLILAAGGALVGGCRLALAKKFSTTHFWKDVRNSGSTVVFYIGELCRYLVSVPERPNEKNHPVRLFMGNGLRQDVWEEMLRRFGNIQVMEFYAATEGNTFLINFTGEKIGSVGRPPFELSNIELVRYDVANNTYIRDDRGFCIPCDDDEPGMMLSRISRLNLTSRFDGYTDASATSKKIMRDVFRKGDQYFVTGDFLRRDADGDYWFVDRLGDTFRWKGENISTDQVAEVIARAPFVAQVAVYGIQVPGHEGRAGMAALQLHPQASFDGDLLFQFVEQQLMPAARPRFVRIVSDLETTDTFKIKKFALQEEGANPAGIFDPIYGYNKDQQSYTQLTPEAYMQMLPTL